MRDAREAPPRVQLGAFERVLASVAPRAAEKRYAARVAIANLQRDYGAAARGRGTEGWRSTGTAADSEIAKAAPILRDRMRDLVRNNPLAAQAVQVLVNNIVGPGIRPRAATANADLNKRVDDLWTRWAARCDAHGPG